MTLYYLLRTVYGYYIKDSATLTMIDTTTLYFIPVVNVDGFKYICEQFMTTGYLRFIRKNRNDGKKNNYTPCSEDDFLGVDLNRNYDFKFALSNIGSSDNVCAEDYRGPSAFSEPET